MKTLITPAALLFFTLSSVALRAETVEIRIATEGSTTDKVIVGYTEKLTLVGELHPEITVLDRLKEGTHQVDISRVPKDTDLLYFICEGYAPIYLRLNNGNSRVAQLEAKLFHTRYVTIRYAENPDGSDFSSTKDDTLALTQYAYPHEGGAWHLMQRNHDHYESGTEPWINYWQQGSRIQWGALESNKPFDSMTQAPTRDTDNYVGGDFPLKRGSSFFLKNTKGYAKLEVMSISTERPQEIKIIEFSPKLKDN
jgi:hypothetical protein